MILWPKEKVVSELIIAKIRKNIPHISIDFVLATTSSTPLAVVPINATLAASSHTQSSTQCCFSKKYGHPIEKCHELERKN